MGWSSKYLIFQQIDKAMRSNDLRSLQTILSSLPAIKHSNEDEAKDMSQLAKRITSFIGRQIEQSLLENNYEQFDKSTALFKNNFMLSDPDARKSYREIIKEFNPAFSKIFTAEEQEQALEKLKTPISKIHFDNKAEQPHSLDKLNEKNDIKVLRK